MPVIELNSANFEKEALESHKPVIVDFWASWCAPCRMMSPVFEQLSDEYKGKAKFGKLNVDSDPKISEKYGIRGIPCLIILHDGKEVDRIVGMNPKETIKKKIDKAVLGSIF
jgi:thioredoxin 1